MTEIVKSWVYHKDYTGPEGRVFTSEDGETFESLAARGYVDHPAKAGFLDVWGERGRKTSEQIWSDFKNDKLPAFDQLVKEKVENDHQRLEKIREEIQAAEAKREELNESIRQQESPAQVKAMREEKEMDDYQDSGAFSEEFLRGMETKRRETQGKKAKTVAA